MACAQPSTRLDGCDPENTSRGDGGEVEIQLVDGALVVTPPTVRKRVEDRDGRATTATHHGASLLTRDDRAAEVYERIGAEVMWVAT